MFPNVPMNDRPNSRLTNPVSICQLSLCDTFGIRFSYLLNFFRHQLLLGPRTDISTSSGSYFSRWDVSPCYTREDVGNRRFSHPEHGCYSALAISRPEFSNLFDFRVSEFCYSYPNSTEPRTMFNLVLDIVFRGIPTQVGKFVVRRISVIVTRLIACWARPYIGFENQSMYAGTKPFGIVTEDYQSVSVDAYVGFASDVQFPVGGYVILAPVWNFFNRLYHAHILYREWAIVKRYL